MTLQASINTASGDVTLLVKPPAEGQSLQLALFNPATGRYLTPQGWANNRKTFGTDVREDGLIELVVPATVAGLVDAGTAITVEDIFANFRDALVWPARPAAPSPATSQAPVTAAPSGPIQSADADATVPVPQRRPRGVPFAFGGGLIVGLVAGAVAMMLWPTSAVPPLPPPAQQAVQPPASTSSEALKSERDRLAERLTEQGKALAAKDAQIVTLTTQVRQGRTSSGQADASAQADLADAQRLIADLRKENLQLQGRQQTDSRAIAGWATERTALNGRIRELEQQAALRDLAPAHNAETAIWMAAAVDRGGSVQTITNQLTRESAETIALKLCGSAECRLVGSYDNACFSLSRPVGQKPTAANWRHAADSNSADAERRALRECEIATGRTCDTRFTVCSPASLSRP